MSLYYIPIKIELKNYPGLEEDKCKAMELVDAKIFYPPANRMEIVGEDPQISETAHTPSYFVNLSKPPRWAICIAINRVTEHAIIVAFAMNSSTTEILEKNNIYPDSKQEHLPRIIFDETVHWPGNEDDTDEINSEKTDSYLYHVYMPRKFEYAIGRSYIEDPFTKLSQTVDGDDKKAMKSLFDCWYIGTSHLTLRGLNLVALIILQEFRRQYQLTRQDCLEFAKSFAIKIAVHENRWSYEKIESCLRGLTVTNPDELMGVKASSEVFSRNSTSSGHAAKISYGSAFNSAHVISNVL